MSESFTFSGEPASSGEASPNFFEFREVCKAFDDRLVLDHVSFTVKRGETCVIMGRSGVGKSVSLKHIMGFLKPDSGRIFIDGRDVTDFSEKQFAEIRRKVTMVFQSGALFDSLTVADNIAFPMEGQPGLTADDIDANVGKLAHLLEVDQVLDKLPGELSTGMRRAIAIARRAHGRPHPSPEERLSQNVHRGNPRHALSQAPRGRRGFPARRQSFLLQSLGRL